MFRKWWNDYRIIYKDGRYRIQKRNFWFRWKPLYPTGIYDYIKGRQFGQLHDSQEKAEEELIKILEHLQEMNKKEKSIIQMNSDTFQEDNPERFI